MERDELIRLAAVEGTAWYLCCLALWMLARVQKLKFGFLKILLTGALVVASGHVPVAGMYLSYVVLFLAVWKFSGASLVPNVVLTVLVAGGLLFSYQTWGVPELEKQLARYVGAGDGVAGGGAAEDPALGTNGTNNTASASGATNATDRTTGPGSKPAQPSSSVAAQAAHAAPSRADAGTPSTNTNSAPATGAGSSGSAGPLSFAQSILKRFSGGGSESGAGAASQLQFRLAGIGGPRAKRIALVSYGTQSQSMAKGETVQFDSGSGKINVRCDEIGTTNIVLTILDQAPQTRLDLTLQPSPEGLK